jgi:hypothetical protein
MTLVRADADCNRERTHQHRRHSLQTQSVIPAKRGGADWRMQGVTTQLGQEFLAPLDHRRACIERMISAVTHKPSARAPGRSLLTPCLQALLLEIAYNIYRLRCFAWLGFFRMSTEPDNL